MGWLVLKKNFYNSKQYGRVAKCKVLAESYQILMQSSGEF